MPSCLEKREGISVYGGSEEGSVENWSSVYFLCNPVRDRAPTLPWSCTTRALRGSRNLETCTETLGCETGAVWSAYELEAEIERKARLPATVEESRRRCSARPEFPPPLTTLRGKGRLRLGRKQKEGRLLLIPFKPFLLEAERTGGRLLLRFLPTECGGETEDEGDVEEEEMEEVAVGGYDGKEGGGEEIEFFVYDSGGKYRRPGRCKEERGGGAGREKRGVAATMFNCDAFWVAS
ncbi:hypothetical protein HPP92_024756 [Vanilla planifolia]|uniref:FAF domain-containing protein n=1 Tax=Vanilla planifolia TaxID=51239 RepID=A0A835U906_VANPL|nr:hypothetical protein HPP92_025059 [Vanilla planifolia]KAG0453452.1 hypothetical protein HPP92_024756 [Vanilla planifolia]